MDIFHFVTRKCLNLKMICLHFNQYIYFLIFLKRYCELFGLKSVLSLFYNKKKYTWFDILLYNACIIYKMNSCIWTFTKVCLHFPNLRPPYVITATQLCINVFIADADDNY